jgi:hypothetical protein
MLTIHNIHRISNYSLAAMSVETTNWAYVFWIDGIYEHGLPHKVTLSRIHPPLDGHSHKDSYCMTYEGQQMWVQRNDVMDCQKFLMQMTHFMANII